MELFISHESALEHWRKYRKLPAQSTQRRCTAALPESVPSVGSLIFSGLSLPIHIVVGSPGARPDSKLARSHVFQGETPVGCFMNIGNSLMISSPEFCFLQMASLCTLVELIELGYELCGAYSLPLPNDKKVPEIGFYKHPPFTSTKKLQAFLADMPGAKGHQQAMRALLYLQDGAASPMETKLAMLLVLPYQLGGYGFPKPILNHRIDLPKAARRFFRKSYYVCDLYWASAKVAVEYDSDQQHTGTERIANDSERRNALALSGVKVVSVTRRQLFSKTELESSARTIAGHLGRRLQFKRSRFDAVHQELRNQLLANFSYAMEQEGLAEGAAGRYR